MDPKEEFRVYMKAVSRQLGDSPALHITEEELIAYQQDRLGGPERGRIQHHFLYCGYCLDRFKDVSDFFEPARRGEDSASEATIVREWEYFRLRNLAAPTTAIVDARPGFRRFFFAPRTLALAASIVMVVTAGWGLWLLNEREQLATQLDKEKSDSAEQVRRLDEENRRLRARDREARENEARRKELEKRNQDLERRATIYEAEIARLTQPELNSPIYDIEEQGSAQRSTAGDPKNSVLVARKAKTVTLILNGAEQPEHADYVIEMFNQKGRLSWRRGGLRRDSLGNFVVTLHRASLGEGGVLLKIYGRNDKGSELIAQYSVLVRLQD